MADSSTRKRCAAVATAAAVASLSLVARAQPAGDAAESAKPIPRNPDGTISFAGTKDDVGNWEGPPGTSLANNVFEDALAGVQAGSAGKFGYVVGINREDAEHAEHLREHGADVVVNDLAELLEVRA